MFSSDIAKIRIAEMKAGGDAATIQRLRKSCADAADILEETAAVLDGKTMPRKEHRKRLAGSLRRGADYLRSLARWSPPKGAK